MMRLWRFVNLEPVEVQVVEVGGDRVVVCTDGQTLSLRRRDFEQTGSSRDRLTGLVFVDADYLAAVQARNAEGDRRHARNEARRARKRERAKLPAAAE